MAAGPLSELVILLGSMHVAATAVCLWLPAFDGFELSRLWLPYVFLLTPLYLVDHFARRARSCPAIEDPLSFSVYVVSVQICQVLRDFEILVLHSAVVTFPWTKCIVSTMFQVANSLWQVGLFKILVFQGGAEGRGAEQFLSYPATQWLVDTGPYRYMRNPMATAMLLSRIISDVLIYGSVRVGIYVVLEFCVLTVWFKYFEEPDLKRRFGRRYETYCRHVPRWLPRLSPYRPYREPKENPNEAALYDC